MTILFIVAAIAFTLFTAVWMLRPFLMSRHGQLNFEMLDEELRQIEALVSRKVALVQALRDIEYDWKTNKISEEDYRRFKKSCERQAVGVMRRLEALHGGNHDWDAVIDRALQERLDAMDADYAQQPWDEARSGDGSADAGPPTCQDCHAPLSTGDIFCSQCGTRVDEPGSSDASDDLQSIGNPPRPSEVAG